MKKGKYFKSKEGELYIYDTSWFENDFTLGEGQIFLIYRISRDIQLVFDSRTSQEKVSSVIGKIEGVYRCCFLNELGKTIKTKTVVVQKKGFYIRIKVKYWSNNSLNEEVYTSTNSYLEKLDGLINEKCEVFYEFSKLIVPSPLFLINEYEFLSFYLETSFSKICETGENDCLIFLIKWINFLQMAIKEDSKDKRNHSVLQIQRLIYKETFDKWRTYMEDELAIDDAMMDYEGRADEYYTKLNLEMSRDGLNEFYEGYTETYLGID